MKLRPLILATSAFALFPTLHAAPPDKLELKKGDHVSILGNELADRMQHTGWLETLIEKKFAADQISFRNLSAAADEVSTWHRSAEFGSRDQWLTWTQADVIFAFYGFNESFKGTAGLDQFKSDLGKFLKEMAAQNFGGKGAPRVVLFSPIAGEKHRDANFADPTEMNANLKLYTAAMAELAKANDVQFIDLFTPSQNVFNEAAAKGQSLTLDGMHLTEAGEKALAPLAFRALFGESAPEGDLAKLNAAVLDKSWQWHQRYRTIDGYNVFGGRSREKYAPKDKDGKVSEPIFNNTVMQREMQMRDVMTANRDARVWAVAKGGDLVVKDDNLPPPVPVGTNKPGDKEDLSWTYPDGQEAIAKIHVNENCKVNLFADEKMFPELANPVQMAWDTKGRLWVAAWKNYPERTPDSKDGDKLLIFEDTNGDGKADKCTTFLGDLNAPTGFSFYKEGVLVMQAPDLWYVPIGKDGKAGTKERVLMGLDSADSHHTTNALNPDPAGAVYPSDGVFHRTQVETANGPIRHSDAIAWRFEPRTMKMEKYAPYGLVNPHGKVWDRWGDDILTNATSNGNYFGPAISGHLDNGDHPGIKDFWNRPSRPCPGTWMLSSGHFPDDWQGNFLNANVISDQCIYRVKVTQDGSGLKGETMEKLVWADPAELPTFRPICTDIGPDGALYFCDWSQTIIGHLQHHLRDPNRDHQHGRIYRITYKGRPLLTPPKIDGQPIAALLDVLKVNEDDTRTLAKVELGKRDSAEVVAAAKKWAASLDKNDKNFEHHRLEALWVHQWHNAVDPDLLNQVLASPEPRARAAAVKVLCYQHDRVPNALALLKIAAEDADPRVRLHAVRAASFFRQWEAADVALTSLKQPSDYYLDYTLKETMRQLEPWWKNAISEGKALAADNPAGIEYILGAVGTADLAKMPKSPVVFTAMLTRPDVTQPQRLEALGELAKAKKTSQVAALLGILEPLGAKGGKAAEDLCRIVLMQSASDLKASRDALQKIAASSTAEVVRHSAQAALIIADNSIDAQWNEAQKSPAALTDFLNALPRVPNPTLRSTAFEKVNLLLTSLPPAMDAAIQSSKAANGRFVRIELPRKGTLTLAEVQVFVDGRNIAGSGVAKQSSTSNSGDAQRAVDGNTDGSFASGTETHTVENENNPWWELDLKTTQPISAIAVWNRSENNGAFVSRLEGFTLTVLDGDRHEVLKKAGIAAPKDSVRIELQSDAAGSVRRAAIRAVTALGKEPQSVFGTLVDLIKKNEQTPTAAQAIMQLPRAAWSKELAAPTVNALVAWAGKIPSDARTAQDYIETVQVANELTGLLAPDAAATARKALKELRVNVFVVKTILEQMRYDTPRLVVEAGKPFEIILENTDAMGHNLVIVKPGTKEKVGTASATMTPDKLDGQGRAFMPNSPDILAATKLVEPGQKETLKFTAPTEEGEYEYVCTVPGHFAIMNGKLIVTKDVDAYLQAHPVAALAPSGPVDHSAHLQVARAK